MPPPFIFDEERVDVLAQRFQTGRDGAEDLAAIVDRRIDEIRGLERPGPIPVGVIGFGADGSASLPNEFAVASALQDANVSVDGLAVAVRTLESLSGVWGEASVQLRQRIADIQAATITEDELADGDLLADIRAERPEDVIRISGASVRGAIPDLPPPGEDPELDALIERFDSALLPGLLSGELDPDDLSKQEQRDLQRITELLGGDDVVVLRRQRTDFVEVAGEDQPITVTTEVTASDADPAQQANFIRNTLAQQGAANTLAAAAGDGVDIDVSTVRGEGGREGGDSQSSVSGEVSIDGGATISTEVVDLGDGLQEVTVTDPTTGTQFSGLRAETEDGFAVTGDITFSDGSTGTVDVFASEEKVEVEIRGKETFSADLDRDNPTTGFGLLDTFARVFENFSLFGTDETPFDDGSDDEGGEPNGGQVEGADPGVGRNDVPDSF